jgi:hypothetical protein
MSQFSNLNISLKEVQKIMKILYYRIVLQTAHSLLMVGEKRKELSLEQRWEIINCRKSLAVLTEELNTFRKFNVSQTVCRRALHSWSLFGRVAARKPLVSLRNGKKG